MELSVINIEGKETGRTVTLPADIFGIEPNEHVVYLSVKQYLANQRQGTHKSKQRAEVSYSTRKIKKQKGTGGARAGSIKSPMFVGGGRVFGPVPRDYSFKLNKKVKTLARRSILSSRAQSSNISIIEDFSFDAPRTKSYLTMLKALEMTGKKTLLILTDHNENVYLSGRNIPKVGITSADSVNVYQMINAEQLLICENAVSKLETILNR